MVDMVVLVWAVSTVTRKSLGPVPRSDLDTLSAVEVPGPHPVGADWTCQPNGYWTRDPELASFKTDASAELDVIAGCARLRYITECAGQEITYIRKEDQARAFLANQSGPVPPFIQAELEAMGSTALAAATLIVDTADLWGTTVGPAIEKARRKGKIAVEAATTIDDVQAALTAYSTTLNAI